MATTDVGRHAGAAGAAGALGTTGAEPAAPRGLLLLALVVVGIGVVRSGSVAGLPLAFGILGYAVASWVVLHRARHGFDDRLGPVQVVGSLALAAGVALGVGADRPDDALALFALPLLVGAMTLRLRRGHVAAVVLVGVAVVATGELDPTAAVTAVGGLVLLGVGVGLVGDGLRGIGETQAAAARILATQRSLLAELVDLDAEDPDRAIAAAVGAVERLGFDAVVFSELVEAPDGELLIRPRAARGIDPALLVPRPCSHGLSGVAVRRGDAVAIERYDTHPEALDVGPRGGAVAAPIVALGRTVGVLAALRSEPGLPEPRTAALVRAVASQLGRVLSNADSLALATRQADRSSTLSAVAAEVLPRAEADLRAPLTAIGGFAQTLDRVGSALEPETRREMADRLAVSSRRLTGVVDDLLTVSRRLEHDAREHEPLLRLVNRLARRLRLALGLRTTVGAVTDVVVEDPLMVEQVVESAVRAAVLCARPDSLQISASGGGCPARLEIDLRLPGAEIDGDALARLRGELGTAGVSLRRTASGLTINWDTP